MDYRENPNLLLLDSYTFGNRRADVEQVRPNHYKISLYLDNRLSSQMTFFNLEEAKKFASNYTDSRQTLNENAK